MEEDPNAALLGNTSSMSVRILDLIASRGEEGMRFTEIQRALWAMSHRPDTPFTRQDRGWWTTNLIYSRSSLLRFFCRKNAQGRWVRNDVPHFGAPWSVMSGK